MDSVREELQVFVRRFGLLNSTCCEVCCGEQISLVQSHILFEVRRMGEPSMQQVAEELGIDVTTFSRQVKGMEGKGMVTRRPAEKDRRVSLLSLTESGVRMLGQIDSYMEERLGQLFEVMTPFEREVVTHSLNLLNGALARVAEMSADRNIVACCK